MATTNEDLARQLTRHADLLTDHMKDDTRLFKELKGTLAEILTQTKATNGRVNQLEVDRVVREALLVQERAQNAENWKHQEEKLAQGVSTKSFYVGIAGLGLMLAGLLAGTGHL